MTRVLLLAAVIGASPAWGQSVTPQTQEDDYTRYELLAPGSAQFRILYEVTATTAGAPYFFNVIRKGSVATDERVLDAATGQAVKWEVVSGAQARAEGHPTADLEAEWIKVHLVRPVPAGGEARVLIDKTYTDARSYFRDGDDIVFDRSLGIRRNSVVLPAGYRLVSCNVPSQVLTTPDGRVMIAFMNSSAAAAPLVIRARPGLLRSSAPPTLPPAPAEAGAPPDLSRVIERARLDPEATYLLDDPGAGTFTVTSDATESQPGTGRHVLAVPPGGRVTKVSAVNLDTGTALDATMVEGSVVVSFPTLAPGASTRIRVTASHTDTLRYFRAGDELVWRRFVLEPRSTVVLPAGWTVVASSAPGTVATRADGRQRLYFEQDRPGELPVLIRARRTAP